MHINRTSPVKQQQFNAFKQEYRLDHGGDIRKGKRKLARPIAVKRPMHIVMRSEKAKGQWSLLKSQNAHIVKTLVRTLSKRFQVKVYDLANAGNHIHMVIQGSNKQGIQNFLRTLAAMLARKITKAKKGSPKGKFWSGLTYSRVINWGREFVTVRKYLLRNRLEATGFLKTHYRGLTLKHSIKIAAFEHGLNLRP